MKQQRLVDKTVVLSRHLPTQSEQKWPERCNGFAAAATHPQRAELVSPGGAPLMSLMGQRTKGASTAALLRSQFALTAAEARVAVLIVDGLSYAEIAARLSISPHTVHTHVKEIHRKLNVHSNGRAAALIRGLGEPE
jgi:DNA-binding CsgD family transcriptional regulator